MKIEEVPRGPVMEEIPIAKLQPSKYNPRHNAGDVDELARSIESVGVLEPILVTADGNGGYRIVSGERRFRAAKKAGLKELPAIVRELTDEERIEISIIENLQRQDLSPLEEAGAYKKLQGLGCTQEKIAERVGKTQSHISKRLQLLELPKEAQRKLHSAGITLEDALELTKLKDMPKRLERVLKRAERGDVEWDVEQELRDHERAEERGQLVQKLKAEGVRVLDRESIDPKAERFLKQQGTWSSVIEITPAKHKGEPCHAAIVQAQYGDPRVLYVCTDHRRHSKNGDSAIKVESTLPPITSTDKAARTRLANEKKIHAEATKARGEAIAAALKRKQPITKVLELLATQSIGFAQSELLKTACRLLGVEPTKKRYGGWDTEGPLLGAIKTKGASKAALAIALAAGENCVTGGWPNVDRKAHYAFLKAHGYEPRPFEKQRLKEKD